jgi:hypothetical protein
MMARDHPKTSTLSSDQAKGSRPDQRRSHRRLRQNAGAEGALHMHPNRLGRKILGAQGLRRPTPRRTPEVWSTTRTMRKSTKHPTEPERKRTLGDFLKELRKLARIEPQFKNKLYRFLTMRNTFIHNLSEVPGWDVRTEEGREVATKFLSELLALAFEVSGVFMSLFTVSAREELGENIIEGNQLMSLIEKQFGPIARKILAARIR